VLSKNVQRRHLSPVQILKVLEVAGPALEAEAVARKRAGVRQGAPPSAADLGPNSAQGGRVSEQIAQMAGVSKDTMKEYHAVQVQGSPQLELERVRSGEASTLQKAVAKARGRVADSRGLPPENNRYGRSASR